MVPGPAGPRVGPNAVIQLAAALRARDDAVAAQVFAAAGMAAALAEPPRHPVPAAEALRLFRALRDMLGPEADAVAAEAGRRTAAYVLAHRIPAAARLLLPLLPAPLALRLLLGAIRRAGGSFGAAGAVALRPGAAPGLVIDPNPLAVPGCPWHVAAIGHLVRRLADPRAEVLHPDCAARGAPACRFEIRRP